MGKGLVPEKYIKAIRELICCQYAKIIARSAFRVADGKSARASSLIPPLAEKNFLKTTYYFNTGTAWVNLG